MAGNVGLMVHPCFAVKSDIAYMDGLTIDVCVLIGRCARVDYTPMCERIEWYG